MNWNFDAPKTFEGRASELIAGFMFRRGRVQLSRPPRFGDGSFVSALQAHLTGDGRPCRGSKSRGWDG